MAKKAKEESQTARPPLPTMADADVQDGVSERMNSLGIEWLRSKITTAEAKANEKSLFSALASEMHLASKLKFWIMTDSGDKKYIGIRAGNEKLKVEKVKVPAPRAKRATTGEAASTTTTTTREAVELPAGDPSSWHLSHLGAKLLKAHVGEDVFGRAKDGDSPIGLTPDQVSKVMDKLKAETIGTLEGLMAGDNLGWWKPISNRADAPLVIRIVESLGSFRNVYRRSAG